ncbi:MAG TPA: Rossmann-like and DUF2520 domain-containing protein [Pyrinomonadaceae bacterium]|nr:Rossmann-like and DUF2520 domain-containing protein [Pyrinomonadaceae bacterium]
MAKENRTAKGRPAISIVGAGRMGGALALALGADGYSVESLVTRRLSHARRVASLLGPQTIALSDRELDKLPASDLILIATPDDIIASVARKLANAQNGIRGDRTVLHTSGALSSTALLPLAKAGFKTGSLHPLLSISDPASGANNLRGAFFCLEGERAALQVARRIVNDLGGRAFSIEAGNKALYHAAAVMASGHMTALFDIALEMLVRCGLSRRRAREVLLPLVQSAVANLAVMEPAEALTGTFARGDLATVQRHLAVLEEQALPAALAAYVLLGQRSLSLVRKKPKASTSAQIARLLKRHER